MAWDISGGPITPSPGGSVEQGKGPGPDTGSASSPARVLVVDDHRELREVLTALLHTAGGFSVVAEAGDGIGAVAAAEQCNPDLIVLDLSMPRMDGLQALPLLKEAAPRARILVVSSFGVDAVVRTAIEAGADGYVTKGKDLVSTFVPAARALVADCEADRDGRQTSRRSMEG